MQMCPLVILQFGSQVRAGDMGMNEWRIRVWMNGEWNFSAEGLQKATRLSKAVNMNGTK